jgi:Ca-activated chloride channel homolog
MIAEPTSTQLRLVAGAVLLLCLAGLALYVRRRSRVAAALGDPVVIRQILGIDLGVIPWARVAVVALAAAALAGALLDPALAATRAGARGPMVLLLDASGSMLVEDTGGPRLEAQRRIARQIVADLPEAPIGIVAFAGRAYSLTPPTRDRASVEMYLASLDPTIVTQTGSALGAAIRQGAGLLAAGDRPGGTLVLVSDGDETEDRDAALEAVVLARRAGIRVHTVGVGTAAGGPVPAVDLAAGTTSGYLRDAAGNLVVSRLGEDLLRAIAGRGDGIHVNASDPAGLLALREDLRGTPREAESPDRGVPAYVLLAALSLLLLAAEPVPAMRGRSGP